MAAKWDGKPVRLEAVNAVVCCTNDNPASGSPVNGSPPVNGSAVNGTNSSFTTESVNVYRHVSQCVFNPIQTKGYLDRTLLL